MGDGSPRPGRGVRRGSGRDYQMGTKPGLPVRALRVVARVLIRLSDAVARWATRVVGDRPGTGREDMPESELRELVANSRVLNREERRLIDDVLAAGDRQVRELMVPRTEAVFLDAAMTIEDAVRTARVTPHSRFPVGRGSQDDVAGFVHLRDLLLRPESDPARTVGDITRPVRQFPATKPALAALAEMRGAGDHVAVVVDEYGGTAGIVTLEDLIEELVGEIHDEYDRAPEADPADGTAPSEVDGLLNLADFADRVGFELEPGPYGTVGGYLMAALGRLPAAGDEVTVATPDGPWRLVVLALEGRRASRVGVARETPVIPVGPQPVAAESASLPVAA